MDENYKVNTEKVITTAPQTPVDKGGFLWGLLGWFIPLVGLILFLVWHDTKPKTAHAAGTGALISVVIGFFFWMLMILAL